VQGIKMRVIQFDTLLVRIIHSIEPIVCADATVLYVEKVVRFGMGDAMLRGRGLKSEKECL